MGFEACPGQGSFWLCRGRNSRGERIGIVKTWSKVQRVTQDGFHFYWFQSALGQAQCIGLRSNFDILTNTFPHTDRKFWSKFCSIPAMQIKQTCYCAWLFHILSNKQGKCLTSHFASCTGLLSLKQNFYHFAAALNLAKRISRGEVTGNPCPCTPKCLFCNSTGASWGNVKNLHRHTLLSVSFQVPKSAFKTSSSAWNRRGIDSLCGVVERGAVLQSDNKPKQAEDEPNEQMEAEDSDFHEAQWGLLMWVRIFNEQLAAAMVIVSTCIGRCLSGFQFKLLLEMGFGFTVRVWNYSYMLWLCTAFSDPRQELGVVVTKDFFELKHSCGHQTHSKS